MRLKLSFFLLLFTQLLFSQLSNFSLTVTPTSASCTSNGTLTFNVSNTTPGSTITYSIYRLPNITTPISVQSSNTLSGLPPGDYRVVATQSLNGNSGTQQQDVTIGSTIVPLTFQITSTNEICGFDGTVTVNVLTGSPVNYEIFSGPVIKPLQTSNVFTGLTTGTYQIRVYDNCGEGVVQTYYVGYTDPDLDFSLDNPVLASCTTVLIGGDFAPHLPYPNGTIKYPLQITTTVYPPSGAPIAYNQTVTGATGFSQIVPLFSPQPYNYTFTITDGCGVVYTLNGVISDLSVSANYLLLPDGCLYKRIAFYNISAITLVSAPATFTTTLPVNYTSQLINNSLFLGGLTAGTYVFNTTDICGVQQVFTVEIIITPPPPPSHIEFNITCATGSTIIYDIKEIIMVSGPVNYPVPLPHDYTSAINSSNYIGFNAIPVGIYVFNVVDLCDEPHTVTIALLPPPQPVVFNISEGCQDGFGSIQMLWQFQSVSVTLAPSAYGFALPHNVMSSVMLGNMLVLDSLPAGNYVIHATNTCNETTDVNFTILGYQETTMANVTPNCGSFDLNLMHSSTNITATNFWLQKWDAVNNTWTHPLTGNIYTDGSVPNPSNSFLLTNNAINYNLAFQGHFRVLKVFTTFVSGNTEPQYCFKVIDEFDYNGLPMITDVYSISCGSTFEVVVEAVGFDPLIYRITTKNGQPFVVQNGNSNVFTGLIPATYNFQVEDACGNVLNSLFEISNPNPMEITANTISCDGETLTLTAPNFTFFQYQWWKDNNTSVILGTSSSLVIPSYNSSLHNGTYHVSISYSNNPASCLNQVLDYVVSLNNPVPEAGQGGNFTYCGRQGNVDLFLLLQGNYDPNGSWEEISASGTLTNNIWDSSNVAFGTYQFKYHVDGSCSQVAEAFITITLNAIPSTPIASADTIVCDNGDLHLYATTVNGAAYHWTGPNGFTATLQNPIISNITSANSGTYTVYVTKDNCQSGDSAVAVTVSALPAFDLSQDCIDGDYVVTVTPIGNSFNPLTALYSWTGPSNFTASQNPIVITRGETGIYNVTVTDESGCATTQSIDVIRTICFIPNVITPNNDATNDSFNLSGFDIDRIEIYNRWGRKVYEKDNYTNEWHGQNMKGERLPDSTYYYILNFRTGENKAGWIFLSADK